MVDQAFTIRGIFRGEQIVRGLQQFSAGFRQVGRDAAIVQRELAPLTSRFAGLTAALAGAVGTRQSLALAERQVDAEQRLLAALQGRVLALERIKAEASDIQRVTRFGDEGLLEVAALLTNMGVAADRIPAALRAATDTSAALGVSLEASAKGIGLFNAGLAGELGERIPELKALQQEGRLAADGIGTLLELFGGQAARQAESTFGRLEQTQNEIGDQAERIGRVIGAVQVPVLREVLEIATSIADVFERRGPAIIRFVDQFAGGLTTVATVLGGLVAGGAIIKFVQFLGRAATSALAIGRAVAGLALRLGPLVLTVGAFAAGLLGATTHVTTMDGLFLSIERLLVRITGATQKFGAVIEAFVLNPMRDVIDAFVQLGQFVGAKIAGVLNRPIAGIPGAPTVGGVLSSRLGIPDLGALTQEIAGGLEKAGFERTAAGVRGLNDRLAEIDRVTEARLSALGSGLSSGVGSAIERFFRTAGAGQEISGRLSDLAGAQGLATISLDDLVDLSPETLRGTIAALDEHLGQQVADSLKARVAEGLESGAISAAQALTLQRELEIGQLERRSQLVEGERAGIQQRLDAAREEVELQQAYLSAIQASGIVALDLAGEVEQLNELQAQANELAEQLATTDERRLELALAIGEAEARIRGLQRASVEGLVSRSEAARRALDEALQSSSALAASGAIGSADAITRQQAALEQFNATTRRNLQALDDLAAKFPELASAAAEARRQIEATAVGIELLNVDDSFLGGFLDGLKAAGEGLNTFRELGLQVGRDVADSLASGVVDVFLEGRKTFREWLGELLKGIGILLIRFGIFKALTETLFNDEPSTQTAGASTGSTLAAGVATSAGSSLLTSGVGGLFKSSPSGGGGGGGGGFFSSLLSLFGGGGGGSSGLAPVNASSAQIAAALANRGFGSSPTFANSGFLGGLLAPFGSASTGLGQFGPQPRATGTTAQGSIYGINNLLSAIGAANAGSEAGLLGTALSQGASPGAASSLAAGQQSLAGASGGLAAVVALEQITGKSFPNLIFEGQDFLFSDDGLGFNFYFEGASPFAALGPNYFNDPTVRAQTQNAILPFTTGASIAPTPVSVPGGGVSGASPFGGFTGALGGAGAGAGAGGINLQWLQLLLGLFGGGGRLEGGPIDAPRRGVDWIGILADGGEYVVKAASHGLYGTARMNAINQGLVPPEVIDAYASRSRISDVGPGRQGGGPIESTRNLGGAAPVRAVVVSDEQQFARLLRGNRRVLMDFLGENRSDVNARLGR